MFSSQVTTHQGLMTTMMIVKPLHLSQTSHLTDTIKTIPFSQSHRSLSKISCVSSPQTPTWLLVDEFNPKIPIEKALTPPSSWYTHPSFLSLELDRVFYKGWQAVGINHYGGVLFYFLFFIFLNLFLYLWGVFD